jgi:hypothetical protein
MGELLTGATFNQLFASFERTARRLETRDHYYVPVEREPFQRFLAGLRDDPDYRVVREPWFASVRAVVAAGKRRQRIRVVPELLTDYLRFELSICRDNVAVGEDVRYLRRDQANDLDLPDHDFWIFDSNRLALLYFTADDRLLGAEMLTDPDMVARHERWIDIAVEHATPYEQFLAEDPTRADPPARGL